jgi:hypothetical protein
LVERIYEGNVKKDKNSYSVKDVHGVFDVSYYLSAKKDIDFVFFYGKQDFGERSLLVKLTETFGPPMQTKDGDEIRYRWSLDGNRDLILTSDHPNWYLLTQHPSRTK